MSQSFLNKCQGHVRICLRSGGGANLIGPATGVKNMVWDLGV